MVEKRQAPKFPTRQVAFAKLFRKNWEKLKDKYSWFGSQMTIRSARRIAIDLARQGKEV